MDHGGGLAAGKALGPAGPVCDDCLLSIVVLLCYGCHDLRLEILQQNN